MGKFYRKPKLEGYFVATIEKIVFGETYMDVFYSIPSENTTKRQRYFYEIFDDNSPAVSFLKYAQRVLKVDDIDDLDDETLSRLKGKKLIVKFELNDEGYVQTVSHVRDTRANEEKYLTIEDDDEDEEDEYEDE